MWIDLSAVVLISVFGAIGMVAGFWSQVMRLIGLLCLFLAIPVVANIIAEVLNEWISFDVPDPALKGIALVVSTITLYIAISFLVAILMRLFPSSGQKTTNRMAGMGMGLVQGFGLCYLLLCGLVWVSESGPDQSGIQRYIIEEAEASIMVGWVKGFNLFDEQGLEWQLNRNPLGNSAVLMQTLEEEVEPEGNAMTQALAPNPYLSGGGTGLTGREETRLLQRSAQTE
jgi:uncharacterized membrane protein required for colicin V production